MLKHRLRAEQEYFDKAVRRIKAEQAQLTLF
jgi:hypothetical protein